MAVIINDMNMPKNCKECSLMKKAQDKFCCPRLHKVFTDTKAEHRDLFCPLEPYDKEK